ncbi:MAG: hybrid sensor histidine kinase/response regulator [Oscillochloris sp.]|nr:hybrid sensor histidine kinase/response regulator [Oscillochloris sp.]
METVRSPQQSSQPAVAQESPTILIVEDQPRAQMTFEALLAIEGYSLFFVADGNEVLQRARQIQPDLILLDVMLPGADGFEVCRQLRADPHLGFVPIIMVTALAEQAAMIEGFAAGVDDFIRKPFNGHELRARVRTTTQLNRYRRLLEQQTRALAAQARFIWATADASDGYVTVTSDDVICSTNATARRYMGLPGDSASIANAHFLDIVSRNYQLAPPESWQGWPAQGRPGVTRYLIRPESSIASEFWIQVDRLDLDGAHEITLRLRNVTAEMRMHRDMWSFQNLAAHKLRTPMVGLLGSLQILSRNIEDTEGIDRSELIDLALQGARRLHQTIEEILSFHSSSRTIASSTPWPLATIPAIAEKICTDLGVLPLLRLIHRGDLATGKLTIAQQRIEGILQELIENSLKFHPQGIPTIEVTVAHEPYGNARVVVVDNGVSLTPEQLAMASTPYYQGEKQFTGQVAGMGLGLATVARMVWAAGGVFHITNRIPGPGVAVEIHLPLTL